jgi:DNA-binding MarR family transcriptional regulator
MDPETIEDEALVYGIEILARPKAQEILLAFFDHEPLDERQLIAMHRKELADKVGGSETTVNKRISELMDAKLIDECYHENDYGRRTLQLTQKGVDVAFCLWMMDYIMSGGSADRLPLPTFLKRRWTDLLKTKLVFTSPKTGKETVIFPPQFKKKQ